jgi:hypothetical protein
MKKFFVLLVMAMSLLGCNDAALQIQARTADGIAQAANASLPMLVERWRQQGFDALEEVLRRKGSREEAEAAVAAVEAEWAPVWKAWDTLQIAQDHWATAIESGGDLGVALTEMVAAYCEFRAVWPKYIPAMPLAPLRCRS